MLSPLCIPVVANTLTSLTPSQSSRPPSPNKHSPSPNPPHGVMLSTGIRAASYKTKIWSIDVETGQVDRFEPLESEEGMFLYRQ